MMSPLMSKGLMHNWMSEFLIKKCKYLHTMSVVRACSWRYFLSVQALQSLRHTFQMSHHLIISDLHAVA